MSGSKKTAQKQVTTIDDLARLVQGEFVVVHKRFDGIDGRLDGIDARLHKVGGSS